MDGFLRTIGVAGNGASYRGEPDVFNTITSAGQWHHATAMNGAGNGCGEFLVVGSVWQYGKPGDPADLHVRRASFDVACGNGIPQLGFGEQCDDGKDGDPSDGCKDDCTTTCASDADCPDCTQACVRVTDGSHGRACQTSPAAEETPCDEGGPGKCDGEGHCVVTSTCGDGVVNGDDECDDGKNGDDADGCTDACTYSCHDDCLPSLDPCTENACWATASGGRACTSLPRAEGDDCGSPALCELTDSCLACHAGRCEPVLCGDLRLDWSEECDKVIGCTTTCDWGPRNADGPAEVTAHMVPSDFTGLQTNPATTSLAGLSNVYGDDFVVAWSGAGDGRTGVFVRAFRPDPATGEDVPLYTSSGPFTAQSLVAELPPGADPTLTTPSVDRAWVNRMRDTLVTWQADDDGDGAWDVFVDCRNFWPLPDGSPAPSDRCHNRFATPLKATEVPAGYQGDATLATVGGASGRPDVARIWAETSPGYARDHVAVVWLSPADDNDDADIIYRRVYAPIATCAEVGGCTGDNNHDATLRGPLAVSATTAGVVRGAPRIAGDTSGHTAVAWTEVDGAANRVMMRRLDIYGDPIGDPILVNSDTALAQRNPTIATVSTGHILVAWEVDGFPGGSGTDIVARWFPWTGDALAPEFLVGEADTLGGDQVLPDANADGEIWVTVGWLSREDQRLHGRRLWSPGPVLTGPFWGGQFPLSPTGEFMPDWMRPAVRTGKSTVGAVWHKPHLDAEDDVRTRTLHYDTCGNDVLDPDEACDPTTMTPVPAGTPEICDPDTCNWAATSAETLESNRSTATATSPVTAGTGGRSTIVFTLDYSNSFDAHAGISIEFSVAFTPAVAGTPADYELIDGTGIATPNAPMTVVTNDDRQAVGFLRSNVPGVAVVTFRRTSAYLRPDGPAVPEAQPGGVIVRFDEPDPEASKLVRMDLDAGGLTMDLSSQSTGASGEGGLPLPDPAIKVELTDATWINPVALPSTGMPAGGAASFTFGMLGIAAQITDAVTGAPVTTGETVSFVISYPSDIPDQTPMWKFGPTPPTHPELCDRTPWTSDPCWYRVPAEQVFYNVDGDPKKVAILVTDGGLGDDDRSANGTIVDPVGPVPGPAEEAIPTLAEWAVFLSLLVLATLGARTLRRRTDALL